jgi:uncharacterized protein
MTNPIVHIEFSAFKAGEAARWYADLFGWTAQEGPGPDYATATWSAEPGNGAGFSQVSERTQAGRILPYIATDDLEAQVARIKEAGGEIVSERIDMAGVGSWYYFRDPTGNVVGCIQPEMPA